MICYNHVKLKMEQIVLLPCDLINAFKPKHTSVNCTALWSSYTPRSKISHLNSHHNVKKVISEALFCKISLLFKISEF